MEACRKLARSSLTLLEDLPMDRPGQLPSSKRAPCKKRAHESSSSHSPAALDEDPDAGDAVGVGLNDLRCCLFFGMPKAKQRVCATGSLQKPSRRLRAA